MKIKEWLKNVNKKSIIECFKRIKDCLKRIKKEDIKAFYNSRAFTNSLLLILVVFCIYAYFNTTYAMWTGGRRVNIPYNASYYEDELNQINRVLDDIKEALEGTYKTPRRYYY